MASVLDREKIKPGMHMTCDGPKALFFKCTEVKDAGFSEIRARLKRAEEVVGMLKNYLHNRKYEPSSSRYLSQRLEPTRLVRNPCW